MLIWQLKLKSFIDERIKEEVKRYEKNFTIDETGVIKEHLMYLSRIEDANNIEPILPYLEKKITPREHLQDLVNQLKNDIYPLFKVPSVTRGAPFTVLRNIFNYIDYIALLRFGAKKGNYGNGMGDVDRLLDDFGPDDMKERYRLYKDYLIQIYRHDLVHLVSPRSKIMKILNSNKKEEIKIIGFCITSETFNDKNGERKNKILDDFEQGCSLMKSVEFRKNRFFNLRLNNGVPNINSISVFFDLINYIKDYQASLSKEENLNRIFAENFIASNLNSALKLVDKKELNMLENYHIAFNSTKFEKSNG
ncbi:MAG: hypothetical protein V1667_02515 [bacterium]